MKRFIQIICLTLLIACFGAVSLLFPQIGLTQSDSVLTYFHVTNIDRSASPTVELTLSGGDGAVQVGVLDVLEDGVSQTILQDRVEERALQLALMADPRGLDVVGATGQPRYLELTGVILKLLENELAVGSDDKIASFYAEEDGGVGTIQAWTDDSGLIFSSFIQQRAEIVLDEGVSLRDSLLSSVDKFEEAGVVKSILLFSAGIDDENSGTTLDELIEQLRLAQIQVYVAHFGQHNQPAAPDQALQKLAQETNGQLLFINSEADFNGLVQRIADSQTQRIVSYESQATPDEVSVQLTLADGSTLTNRLDSDGKVIESYTTEAVIAEAMDAAVDAEAMAETTEMSDESETSTDGVADSIQAAAAESVAGASNEAGNEAMISIPGTGISLSSTLLRNLLLGALAATFALIAYFVLADFRARNSQKKQVNAITTAEGYDMHTGMHTGMQTGMHTAAVDHNYQQTQSQLQAPLQLREEMTRELPSQQPQYVGTQIMDPQGLEQFTAETAALQQAVQNNTRTIEVLVDRLQNQAPPRDADIILESRSGSGVMTSVPKFDQVVAEVNMGGQFDNESQVHDIVVQPMLGYLIRVTEDTKLPLQLPFYQVEKEDGEEQHIRIGRNGQRNTVVINSAGISREHAVVIQKEDGLYLRDNESTAGTSLNWRKLKAAEEVLLRNNDLVSFGDVSYEFRAHDEDEASEMAG